jgi:hypothetical protein
MVAVPPGSPTASSAVEAMFLAGKSL